MIKSRHAVLGFNIIGSAIAGHAVDEVDYRLFAGAVIPGRQRIAFRAAERAPARYDENQQQPHCNSHHSSSHLNILLMPLRMKLRRVTLLSLQSNDKVKFQATFEVSRASPARQAGR
jgi:hypothetical protein